MTTINLIAQLEELPELKPLPAVATNLIEMSQDPDVNLKQLSDIIECEPALSMQMLRISNSSMYGFSGQIASVSQAVVVLGMREVRNLIMSMVAGEVFAQKGPGARARKDLWGHSMATAAVARFLSKHVPDVPSDAAFLAGVVHDIGKLIFLDLAPDDYQSLQADMTPQNVIDIESETFGTCHQEIGQRCADEWGLPADISDAIGGHHQPADAEFSVELIQTVSAADRLAHHWGIGQTETPDADPVDAEADAAAVQEMLAVADITLSADAIETLKDNAVSVFNSVSGMCGSA